MGRAFSYISVRDLSKSVVWDLRRFESLFAILVADLSCVCCRARANDLHGTTGWFAHDAYSYDVV